MDVSKPNKIERSAFPPNKYLLTPYTMHPPTKAAITLPPVPKSAKPVIFPDL